MKRRMSIIFGAVLAAMSIAMSIYYFVKYRAMWREPQTAAAD